jgi:hypothetical protein
MKKTIMMVILIFLAISYVMAEDVDPGECTIFNTTNMTEIEVCGGECISNITLETFSINMTAGETIHQNSEWCDVTAECIADTQSDQERCVLEHELDPGEVYRKDNEWCDIEIQCEEEQKEDVCNDIYEKEYIKTFVIEVENSTDKVNIKFGDKEFSTQLTDGMYISGELPFTCPQEVVDVGDANVTLEECKAVIPLYCNDYADLLIKQNNALHEQKVKYEEELNTCRIEKGKVTDESVCVPNWKYSELLANHTVTADASESCIYQLGKSEDNLDDQKNWSSELGVTALFFCCTTVWFYFNPRQEKHDGELGGPI